VELEAKEAFVQERLAQLERAQQLSVPYGSRGPGPSAVAPRRGPPVATHAPQPPPAAAAQQQQQYAEPHGGDDTWRGGQSEERRRRRRGASASDSDSGSGSGSDATSGSGSRRAPPVRYDAPHPALNGPLLRRAPPAGPQHAPGLLGYIAEVVDTLSGGGACVGDDDGDGWFEAEEREPGGLAAANARSARRMRACGALGAAGTPKRRGGGGRVPPRRSPSSRERELERISSRPPSSLRPPSSSAYAAQPQLPPAARAPQQASARRGAPRVYYDSEPETDSDERSFNSEDEEDEDEQWSFDERGGSGEEWSDEDEEGEGDALAAAQAALRAVQAAEDVPARAAGGQRRGPAPALAPKPRMAPRHVRWSSSSSSGADEGRAPPPRRGAASPAAAAPPVRRARTPSDVAYDDGAGAGGWDTPQPRLPRGPESSVAAGSPRASRRAVAAPGPSALLPPAPSRAASSVASGAAADRGRADALAQMRDAARTAARTGTAVAPPEMPSPPRRRAAADAPPPPSRRRGGTGS
jgi:hypothetical protein